MHFTHYVGPTCEVVGSHSGVTAMSTGKYLLYRRSLYDLPKRQ
jgi:hypothetical protein